MLVNSPSTTETETASPGPEPDTLKRSIALTVLTFIGLAIGLSGQHLLDSHPQGDLVKWGGYIVAYLAGGIPAAIQAFDSLINERKLDVDLLMILAALGAASIGQSADGAILLLLFSISNTLQDWAMGRTTRAVQALMELNPEGATVTRDGVERWLALDDITVGDVLVIKPGERIAADAEIVAGETAVDESPITGESIPVDKTPGDEIASGTVNLHGAIQAKVLRPAGESTLAKLVTLMEEASTQKSRTEHITEKYESPYAMVVLALVPITFAALYFGANLGANESWYRAMTLMVVASPCAVVISTPAVMLSAMASAARSGVLFKSSAALDALASVKTFAFDKTGTLTKAQMRVTDFVAEDKKLALSLAASLEQHSEHPIAEAIVAYAQNSDIETIKVDNAKAVPGHGIEGVAPNNQGLLWAGNIRMAERHNAEVPEHFATPLATLANDGASVVLVGQGTKIVGVIGVADTLRDGVTSVIGDLKIAGIDNAVMLTGDKREVAEQVSKEVGLTAYHAELLPEDKLRLVAELPAPLAMVGDGVNDAPALARADLGIAVASGTDVAIESADVVLVQNDLNKLVGAVKLAKEARRTVIFNLCFALAVIVLIAPFAVAGQVPLPLGVFAHEGGTVFVVFMGLRLLARRF